MLNTARKRTRGETVCASCTCVSVATLRVPHDLHRSNTADIVLEQQSLTDFSTPDDKAWKQQKLYGLQVQTGWKIWQTCYRVVWMVQCNPTYNIHYLIQTITSHVRHKRNALIPIRIMCTAHNIACTAHSISCTAHYTSHTCHKQFAGHTDQLIDWLHRGPTEGESTRKYFYVKSH